MKKQIINKKIKKENFILPLHKPFLCPGEFYFGPKWLKLEEM